MCFPNCSQIIQLLAMYYRFIYLFIFIIFFSGLISWVPRLGFLCFPFYAMTYSIFLLVSPLYYSLLSPIFDCGKMEISSHAKAWQDLSSYVNAQVSFLTTAITQLQMKRGKQNIVLGISNYGGCSCKNLEVRYY